MSHITSRETSHSGPIPFAKIHAEQNRLRHAHYPSNVVDPTHAVPFVPRNMEVEREILRNWRIVAWQQVGKAYYYKLEDGRELLSFIPPERIQYQPGV